MNWSLFIVDDHSMLRNGLQNYLERNSKWKADGVFANGEECLTKLKGLSSSDYPQIIIIDIQLANGESGFSLVQEIKKKYPAIKVILYSMYDTWGFILQAKDLGVDGYISKVEDDKELLRCISLVAAGEKYFKKKSNSIQQELESIIPILTKQEKTIFEMALQGKSNKQISEELFISLHTVENYISYLVKLSSCKNRDQMIQKYL